MVKIWNLNNYLTMILGVICIGFGIYVPDPYFTINYVFLGYIIFIMGAKDLET